MLTTQEIISKYGTPNETGQGYLAKIILPYPMRLAWDLNTKVTSIRCHKLLINNFSAVFSNLLSIYGYEKLVELGIDLYGGCFNFRKMRNGNEWSTHCIPAGERVWMKNKSIEIQDIVVGDMVLSFNRETKALEEKQVTNIFVNGKKNILQVNIRNNPIRCSKDHMIMIVKKTTLDKSEFIYHKNKIGAIRALYTVELVRASELQKGDKVLVLRNANNLIRSNTQNLRWFEILGMYIGDGCFHRRKGKGCNYVSFQFPKNDRVRDHAKDLLTQEFSMVKESDTALFLYRKEDFERFRIYDYKAKDKFIPEEVYNGSKEQILAFIKGVIYSDGYTSKVYNKKNRELYTTPYHIKMGSKRLLYELKHLCTIVGIKASKVTISKGGERVIKGVRTVSQERYNVTLTDYDELIDLDDDSVYAERQNGANKFKTYNSHCWGYEHIGDQFAMESVMNVIEIDNMDTYDIEVADNHLFILNGTVVSNSWAIAIDLHPEKNQLKQNHTKALFARPEYKPMIDSFYKQGFISLGIERDFDWMHFQIN